MIKTIITILIPFLLFSVNAFGADWYISTTGNDTTGDGSSELPWATTAKARKSASAIAAGDTVIFKNGTYTEGTHFNDGDQILGYSSDDSGTNTAKITYKAEIRGGVTFDLNLKKGLIFDLNADNIIIDGINVTNYSGAGIQILGENVEVRYCSIIAHSNDVGRLGAISIYMGAENFLIEHCEASSTDIDLAVGIYIQGGSGTVRDSVFRDNSGNGVQIQAGIAEYHIGEVYIYRNKVYGNSERHGIYVSAYSGGAIDAVYIYNNLVWNNGKNFASGYGITIGSEVTYGECKNNTLYDHRAGINHQGLAGTLQNNIIMNSSSGDISYGTSINTNITKSHNLTTDGDEGVDYGVLGAFATTDFESTTDTDEDFLKLKSTASTAINAGTDTGITDDYFETVRDANIDIGAHEYASTATTHSKSFAGGCGNIR